MKHAYPDYHYRLETCFRLPIPCSPSDTKVYWVTVRMVNGNPCDSDNVEIYVDKSLPLYQTNEVTGELELTGWGNVNPQEDDYTVFEVTHFAEVTEVLPAT